MGLQPTQLGTLELYPMGARAGTFCGNSAANARPATLATALWHTGLSLGEPVYRNSLAGHSGSRPPVARRATRIRHSCTEQCRAPRTYGVCQTYLGGSACKVLNELTGFGATTNARDKLVTREMTTGMVCPSCT